MYALTHPHRGISEVAHCRDEIVGREAERQINRHRDS